ncbi:MAG TPA: PQQ-binding-like beta-propeller repeat protein [Clostridia bacterium]|nr:PQQ-binding-like beta-propeller repeat protein [Clostridia bacterium]
MYKKRLTLLVMVFFLSCFSGLAEPGLSETVTADQNDPSSPLSGGRLIHWTNQLGLPESSKPVIDKNDTAYFTSERELTAVNKFGKKLWSWNCTERLNKPQLGPDGIIYVTSGLGILYAIDTNGNEIWESREPANSVKKPFYSCTGCTVGNDGTIYFIIIYENPLSREVRKDCGSVLIAANSDGTLKWSADTNKTSISANVPVVNDSGTIFIDYLYRSPYIFRQGYIYRTFIDAFDKYGKLMWEQAIPANNEAGCNPLLLNGNKGVFLCADYKLYVFDSDGNANYYDYKDKFLDTNGIAAASDGGCAVTCGSSVYFLDQDCKEKWKFDANGRVDCIPMLDSNDSVYFVTEKGTFYCIDKQGRKIWEKQLSGQFNGSSPVIRSDGIAYQFNNNGDLYALGKFKVDSLKLETHDVTLLANGMKGILKPLNNTESTSGIIKWSSDDPGIATVKDGVVTPVSSGKTVARVYSEDGKLLDTCNVSVISQPYPDITLTCDTVLSRNFSSHAGMYNFNNLTINDNVTITSEGISEIELNVKGVLKIGKGASIRVRNGCYVEAPSVKISSLTPEALNKSTFRKNGNILSIPGLYGKGGNGGNGGNGVYTQNIKLSGQPNTDNVLDMSSGGGGGAGGFGGGAGGKGGMGTKNFIVKDPDKTSNDEAGKGLNGTNNGGTGGEVNGTAFLSKIIEVVLNGGNGGGSSGVGENGYSGRKFAEGGSGGGGNGGSGGSGATKANTPILYYNNVRDGSGGGGGGGGGYGGGVLVIVAGSINVQSSNIPCFIVSGQTGGKGGHPNGQNGENGEGGLLVIETNNYSPSLSHWNIGEGVIECSNSNVNGGHGAVSGNPQKVFLNGKDMSDYNINSVQTFNIGDRSAALIKKIN